MIVVETSSRMQYAATRHFYEARGYEQAACITDFYAPADDRVIYTKRFVEAQVLSSTPDRTRSRHPNE